MSRLNTIVDPILSVFTPKNSSERNNKTSEKELATWFLCDYINKPHIYLQSISDY